MKAVKDIDKRHKQKNLNRGKIVKKGEVENTKYS